MDNFPQAFEWFIPNFTQGRMKAAAEETGSASTAAANAAAEPDTTPAPDAKHIEVGKQIQSSFSDIKPTIDIYGKGAQAHGSPWKGNVSDYEGVKTKLRQLGYRPKGKDVYVRFPVEVDLGTDKDFLYLYITDDNPR